VTTKGPELREWEQECKRHIENRKLKSRSVNEFVRGVDQGFAYFRGLADAAIAELLREIEGRELARVHALNRADKAETEVARLKGMLPEDDEEDDHTGRVPERAARYEESQEVST